MMLSICRFQKNEKYLRRSEIEQDSSAMAWIPTFLWFLFLATPSEALTISLNRRDFLFSAALSVTVSLEDDSIVLSHTSRPVSMPGIGYSLYKTAPDQVAEGIRLALEAGTRHFDVATSYGTNDIAGEALKGQKVFLTHKVSNAEQSNNLRTVQQSVKKQQRLLCQPIDLVMLHSPLVKDKRLASYEALLELQSKRKVKAVGVCHYGLGPLQEIVDAGLPPPSVIQLAQSPFAAHTDIVDWAKQHNSTIVCSAWSKLSSQVGPQEGWSRLGTLAGEKGYTKQQVLIRWARQKGYACVPRSSSKYKIERQAIAENSRRAVQQLSLTSSEMKLIDSLNEDISAGRLGLVDGWAESDIRDSTWDPTLIG